MISFQPLACFYFLLGDYMFVKWSQLSTYLQKGQQNSVQLCDDALFKGFVKFKKIQGKIE